MSFGINDIAPELYKNIIKFPLGVNFKYNGQLLHNLDRVWVVTKVPLPRISEIQFKEIAFVEKCSWLNGMPTNKRSEIAQKEQIEKLCAIVDPVIEWYKSREDYFKKQIHHKIAVDVRAALDDLISAGIEKRFLPALIPIGTSLVTIAAEALSSHLQRKRVAAINKGLQGLKAQREADRRNFHNMVKQLQDDFVMIGEYNVNSTSEIITTMNKMALRQTTLEKCVTGQLTKFQETFYKSQFGAMMFGFELQLYLQMIAERQTNIYTPLLKELDALIKAISVLSKGRLPVEIYNPDRLDQILKEVKAMLQKDHENFKLALPHLTHYYDMKLVTFGIQKDENALVVSFPIFIQKENHKTMTLYEIETVPVPIVDLNTDAQSYTMVEILKPYIAVGTDSYIQLRIQELNMCKQIRDIAICEELFLVKHKSKHSCEAAIFFDQPEENLKQNCKFKYYFNTTVQPSVLDGGQVMVLANMIKQKKLNCAPHLQVETPFNDNDYVLVNRSILCNCEIVSDMSYVLQSLGSCSESRTSNPILFTVNMAFQMYLDEWANYSYLKDLPTFPTEHETTIPVFLNDTLIRTNEGLSEPKYLHDFVQGIKQKYMEQNSFTTTEPDEFTEIISNEKSKIFVFLASIISLGTTFLVVWLFLRNYRLSTLVSAITTHPSTAEAVSALSEALSQQEPNLAFCQEPIITKTVTIITFIGIIIYIFTCIHKIIKRWKGFRYSDTCKIQIFISKRNFYVPVTIYKRTGNPFGYTILESLQANCVTLQKNLLWDILKVDWGENIIKFENQGIPLKSRYLIPLKDKSRIRHIMRNNLHSVYIQVKQGNYYHMIPEERNTNIV